MDPIEKLKMESEQKEISYDTRFCGCGTIHFIPRDLIHETIDAEKDLLVICGSCGNTFVIGADKLSYDPYDENNDGPVFEMYSYYKNSNFIIKDGVLEFSDVSDGAVKQQVVYYNKGVKVMMKTGYKATQFWQEKFYDNMYPDLDVLHRVDATIEQVRESIDKWYVDRITVRMSDLIEKCTDSQLKSLSGYLIVGLDWTGTPYERK